MNISMRRGDDDANIISFMVFTSEIDDRSIIAYPIEGVTAYFIQNHTVVFSSSDPAYRSL